MALHNKINYTHAHPHKAVMGKLRNKEVIRHIKKQMAKW